MCKIYIYIYIYIIHLILCVCVCVCVCVLNIFGAEGGQRIVAHLQRENKACMVSEGHRDIDAH